MANGREVVVTGGGTGIGYAVAARFAAAGERVTITGRRERVLAEAATRLGCRHVAFDAADPDQVGGALAELPDGVDVLVNNAGGNTDFDRPEPDADDLRAIAGNLRSNLEANLISAVLVTTALTPRLRRGARVITMGSIAAHKGAGSYGAAKAAIEAWNVDLARRVGEHGVTANVIAPGLVGDTEFFRGRLDADRRELLVGQTFTKRPGAPEDIAAMAGFLASEAAGHVTGQVLHVNGGAHPGR